MIIIDKETLELMNEVDVLNDERYKHIMFDFSDAELVGEALSWVGLAIVNMPNQPVFDARYYYAAPTNVTENDGVYSGEWMLLPVDIPVTEIAARKIEEMNARCEQEITAGFYSSALGDTYRYSSDRDSQMNIQGNVLVATQGLDTRHICYDQEGQRFVHPHTPDQMKEVGLSLSAHIWTQLDRFNTIRGLVQQNVENNDAIGLCSIQW